MWRRGVQFVAGIDEAGRGALAGPVVVAAVVLVRGVAVTGARDSKLLTERQRDGVRRALEATARAAGRGARGGVDDVVAHELREAADQLGSVVEPITSEEVVAQIFRTFCVGK